MLCSLPTKTESHGEHHLDENDERRVEAGGIEIEEEEGNEEKSVPWTSFSPHSKKQRQSEHRERRQIVQRKLNVIPSVGSSSSLSLEPLDMLAQEEDAEIAELAAVVRARGAEEKRKAETGEKTAAVAGQYHIIVEKDEDDNDNDADNRSAASCSTTERIISEGSSTDHVGASILSSPFSNTTTAPLQVRSANQRMLSETSTVDPMQSSSCFTSLTARYRGVSTAQPTVIPPPASVITPSGPPPQSSSSSSSPSCSASSPSVASKACSMHHDTDQRHEKKDQTHEGMSSPCLMFRLVTHIFFCISRRR